MKTKTREELRREIEALSAEIKAKRQQVKKLKFIEPTTPWAMTIYAMRRERGWSQNELMQRSGLSPATIYKTEIGKAENPKLSTLQGMSRTFGVSVISLLETYLTNQQKGQQ